VSEIDQKFDNLLQQTMNSLDVFEKTGRRTQFIALLDQLNSFGEEIGGKDWRENYEKKRFGSTSEGDI